MATIGVAPAGAIIAAAVSLRRKKILRAFRQHEALSAKSAKSSQELAVRRSLVFRRMLRVGVLVDAGQERYYLDEAAAENDRRLRLRRAGWLLAATTATVLIILALQHF